MPDGISSYKVGSQNYLVTANEGDARADWGAANNEENRVGDAAYVLDTAKFGGTSAVTAIRSNLALGRLTVTNRYGDFNNDGKPDVATANNDDATVSIKLGSGTGGQFATAATVNAGAGVFSIAAADFNIDGFLDVICANSDASTVSVLLGNGTGQFPSNKETSAPSGIHFISVGDFNEDGLQDVAITNGGNNNITILGGAFNEIAVKGNDNFITDGDNTPSLIDHTDFGSLFIGSNTLRSFTIFNTGIDSLRITAASISGPVAFQLGPIR
jgi:hypothetical protein